MKKLNKKFLVLLIAVTLLLTFAVSGTVAYLVASTDPVENVFKPVEVDTVIRETTAAGSKSGIAVENKQTDKAIPVYVRVAVVGNWVDADGNIVAAWNGPISYDTANWALKNDGYYYYNSVLAVGATTPNLLTNPITETNKPAGADHLEVTVVHQAIQADPVDAVKAAWKWTPPTAD